jgi:hypothetical protein
MDDHAPLQEDPRPVPGLDRRRLLAYAGTAAVATSLALRPSAAQAAVALGETDSTVTTVAEALAEAALSEWGGHQNGRVPASSLTPVLATVQGSGYLRPDAARDYFSLSLAFSSAVGRSLDITEGYRDHDRQVEYWNRYQAGTGNLAAYPGTSNHGWGISCDFASGVQNAGTDAKRWMDANAPSYGWSPTGNTFSRPEAWHFDYVRPWRGPIATDDDRSLDVLVVRCNQPLPGVGSGFIAAVGVRFMHHLTSGDQVNAMRTVGAPYYDVGQAAFLDMLDALSIPRSALVGGADHWRR